MTARTPAAAPGADVGSQPLPWRHPGTWRTPLLAWLISRAVVFATAVVVSLTLGPPDLGVDRIVPRSLLVLGAWDTSWYLDIATRGYDSYTDLAGAVYTNLPFFPLVPMVMKVGIALGANPFMFALVVNNLAFLAALVVLGRLTRQRFGPRMGELTVWAAALFPASAYASMAYTEAITMLLAVGAAYLSLRDRWRWAAAVAALAVLARPPGAMVSVLVAAMSWYRGGTRRERLRRAAWLILPAVLTLLAFLVWMQVFRGSWRLPFQAQEAWRRGPLGVGLITYLPVEIGDAVRALLRGDWFQFWTPLVRQGTVTVAYLVLLWRLARWERHGCRSPWVVYSAATLALPLASGSFTSMTRFGLLAFPLAWPVCAWLEGRSARLRRLAAFLAVAGLVVLVTELHFYSP